MGNGGSSNGIQKQGLQRELYASNVKSGRDLRSNLEKVAENKVTFNASVVTNVRSEVEQRFKSSISSVASDLNRRDAQVKQSKNDLKSEKNILIRLKVALETEDQEEVDQAKSELTELRVIRLERQTQIESEQRVGGKSRKLSSANQDNGSLELPELNLSKIATDVPDNSKDLDLQLYSAEKDLEQLDSLDQPIKEARNKLSQALKSSQPELAATKENSLIAEQAAEFLAENISDRASILSSSELLRSVFNKPNINTVKIVLE